ncbi:MAG: Tim44/TimA family putative adaptor protein [Kiloniellales bacterium]|jgi:predicted lipid-binding transport protein (Tim44 family)
MGNGFQFLDIILFAAVAAFFVLRLRGVLGKRSGHQKPPRGHDRLGRRRSGEEDEDKVIPLPGRTQERSADEAEESAEESAEAAAEAAAAEERAETPLALALLKIKRADKSFDETTFEEGARACFEMVIDAFAAGDTKTLRPLLSNDVYGDFAGAIEERQENGEVLETSLVGISPPEIVEAELQGRTAFVTVKFVSEQVNVVRDKQGEVVDGDPNHVAKITDLWTFARNTRSRDPNWTLVATQSPN